MKRVVTPGWRYVEVENIFEALDLEDAAALRAQTLLGVEVCKRIHAMKAGQKKIAARLGIKQPQVSELRRGKFDRFSRDRMIGLLSALRCDVELRVTPAPRRRAGRLTVGAA